MGRLASSVPLQFDDQNQNHSFLMGIAALNPSYELTRLAAKAPPTVSWVISTVAYKADYLWEGL
jgi:hypothetical protein